MSEDERAIRDVTVLGCDGVSAEKYTQEWRRKRLLSTLSTGHTSPGDVCDEINSYE